MRILFDENTALHEAASKNVTREILCGVFVHKDGETFRAVATNGCLLVAQEVVVEGYVSDVIIPAEVWKAAWKAARKAHCVIEVDNNTATVPDGLSLPLIEGSYPDYKQVIPDYVATHKLCLGAEVFKQLAKTLRADSIEFEWNNPENAIRVIDPARTAVFMGFRQHA